MVGSFGVWQLRLLEKMWPPAGADDFWDWRERTGIDNSVYLHRLEVTRPNGRVFVVGNSNEYRWTIPASGGHGDDLDAQIVW